jgi:hypothetical protein
MTDQPTTKATRTTHTPAEKATEAVAVLRRRLAKLTKSKAAFELQALNLEPQIEVVTLALEWALSNPDLPKSPADIVVGPYDIPELKGQEFEKTLPVQPEVAVLDASSEEEHKKSTWEQYKAAHTPVAT